MSIEAVRTWGLGPDICIEIKDEEYGVMLHGHPSHFDMAKYGYCGNATIGLRLKEAKELLISLALGIADIEGIEASVTAYTNLAEYFKGKTNE